MSSTEEDLLSRAREQRLTWHSDGAGSYVTAFEGETLTARLGEGDFYESTTFEVFREGVLLGGFDFWPWKWKISGLGGFLKRLAWSSIFPRS